MIEHGRIRDMVNRVRVKSTRPIETDELLQLLSVRQNKMADIVVNC